MEQSRADIAEHRMRGRARQIAAAVKNLRRQHDWSLRRLAREANIGVATLNRLENPDPEQPTGITLDTLEALADAMRCPLALLLGEPVSVVHKDLGDWPAALKEVLAARATPPTHQERAFIEHRIMEYRAIRDGTNLPIGPGLTWSDSSREFAARQMADPDFWRTELDSLRQSRRWQIVEKLILGSQLDPHEDALAGLDWLTDTSLAAAGEHGLNLLRQRALAAGDYHDLLVKLVAQEDGVEKTGESTGELKGDDDGSSDSSA